MAGNDTLTGYGGTDKINGGTGNDVLYGGDGNDTISGDADDDELHGDAGNDRIWGGTGNDEIYGGAGDDNIIGGAGNNTLYGGDGNDTIYAGDNINANGSASINTLVGGLGFDLLYGTSGNDIFIDGEGNDQNLFSGGGGNDIFRVIGSSEIFIDNTSTNIQYGTIELPSVYESEADLTIELQGHDLVISGSIPGYEILIRVVDQFPNFAVVQTISFSNGYNFDLLTLMGAMHTQYGTTGDDTINSLVTLPTINGHPNELVDYIYGGDGRDRLFGFGGDDHLFGEEGADFLYGGTGNDTLHGGTENDSIYGGDGDDLIEGGEGGDYLTGEAGADTIIGGNGNDNIYGGDGQDNLSGGDGIDTLYGGAGSNIIDGGAQNDNIISDRGVSTGYVGSVSGYDTMHGGQGNDTYSIYANVISRQDQIEDNGAAADYDGILFIGSVSTTKFRLVEGISTDLILDLGTIGTVTLKNQFAQDYTDRVEYYRINNGAVTLLQNRTFVFEGTEAADNLYMPQYSLLANSSILGYGGNDNIYGSANRDILNGGAGDDNLHGNSGNDDLTGGDGNDTLYGGLGADTLTGGSGNDIYVYNLSDGYDQIFEGSSAGTDSLVLGSGILPSDVRMWIDNLRNLHVTFANQLSDEIVIAGDSAGGAYLTKLESIIFDNNTVWDLTQGLTLVDTDASHQILGTNQSDLIDGRGGSDDIQGFGGNDTLSGGSGNNRLRGGQGDDTYIIASGSVNTIEEDTIGGGIDTIYLSDDMSSATIRSWVDSTGKMHIATEDGQERVAFNGTLSSTGVDLHTRVENIFFSNGFRWDLSQGLNLTDTDIGHSSYGSAFNDSIDGRGGSDSIVTYGGNDLVYGGGGSDSIYLMDGDDVAWGDAEDEDNIDVGSDIIDGGEGDDEIHGGGGDDYLIGGNGDDLIFGDHINSSGDDQIYGGNGNDTIYGGYGYDIISGGDGDDVIYTSLNTESGIVSGNDGNDYIYGNLGYDIYVFNAGDDEDVIFDIEGYDSINFGEGILSSDITLTKTGANLEITFANSLTDKITVIDHYKVGSDNYFYNRLERINFFDGSTLDTGNYGAVTQDDSFNMSQGGVLAGNLFADNGNGVDYDPDGDALYIYAQTYTLSSGATVSLSTNGDFTYTPLASFSGNDTFTYDAYEDFGFGPSYSYDRGTVTIYVEAASLNAAPDAKDDNFSASHGANITGNLISNNGNGADSDSDGGTLSIVETNIISAQGRSITVSSNGNFTYFASMDYVGNDSFTYTLSDGQGATDTALVSITVNAPAGSIVGSSSGDTLSGNSSANNIFGLEGADIIDGLDGNDTLYGYIGDDTIYGGNGSDNLDGGEGADNLQGGSGNDNYYYRSSMTASGDLIEDNGTASDSDKIYFYNLSSSTAPVFSLISGNIADLAVTTEWGTLVIKNQFVSDTTDRIETIYYQALGGALMSASTTSYSFIGNSSDEVLTMPSYGLHATQIQKIYGEGGNDTITGRSVADELHGGSGLDILYGGDGADLLYGESGSDSLYGQAGADYLYGGTGADDLQGGSGNDYYYFNEASSAEGDVIEDNGSSSDTTDRIHFTNLTTATAPVMKLLSGNVLDLVITTEWGSLTVKNQFSSDASDRIETIYYQATGGSVLTASTTSYVFQGSETDDVLTMPSYGLHATNAQTIYGNSGNDTITGRSVSDYLYGGDGNDILYGGAGSDTIYGDSGNDIIYGQSGIDYIFGNAGADTFVFDNTATSDTIYDFNLSDGDKLDISDVLQGYDPLTHAITDFVQITTSGSNSILKIDANGGANSFVQVATLSGVTGLTDEAALVASGNLLAT